MSADKQRLKEIFGLFFDEQPKDFQIISTGISAADFRETVIAVTDLGTKRVLKLADNDFTFPEKIKIWQQTVHEYKELGYYCPEIFADKSGEFPLVQYKGHRCVACAEEFSLYKAAENRAEEDSAVIENEDIKRDMWIMTAKAAEKHFDFTDYPSGYCLFERFCPSDKIDEVLERALAWKECAEKLPEEFKEQANRIWKLWSDNRSRLEQIYLCFAG